MLRNITALVAAAGKGERCNNSPKAFMKLENKTLLEIVVHKLSLKFKSVLVGVDSEYLAVAKKLLGSCAEIYEGGNTRSETYCKLVEKINTKYALIQDIARPFFDLELIEKLIYNIQYADGVGIGHNLTTSIGSAEHYEVKHFTPRDNAFEIQTPQLYKSEVLRHLLQDAICSNGSNCNTTPWEVLVNSNKKFMLVPSFGFNYNFKITTKMDWEIAKLLYKKMRDKYEQ